MGTSPPATDAALRAALAARDWDAAAALLAQRTRAQPADAQAWGLQALVARNRGQPAAALAAAQRATALDPALLPGWLELAEAQLLNGAESAAHEALRSADRLAPSGPNLVRLALLLHRSGLHALALPRLRQCAALRPRDASVWRALADALARSGGDDEQRLQASARAAQLGGGARDWMQHAHSCFDADRFAAGHAALARVLAADAGFLPARWSAFQLPHAPAPQDAAAAARFLADWDAGVAAFAALDPADAAVRRHVPGCLAQCTAFFRHYLDDALHAQRRHGAMLAHLAGALGPRRRTTRNQLRSGRRRIGYCTRLLREHTVDRLFGPLVAGLPAAEFEVHVLALAPPAAAQAARHAAAGQQLHGQPRSAVDWAAHIAALDLDVLLFAEVGMDPTAQLLASLRLAPVQAMLWGHPVTTGLDSIDYVLSPDLLEPANAASHYSETLLRLPGLGCAALPPSAPAQTAAASGAPGLEILCAQTVYKLLPAQDALFARVLAALPGARLHLIAHPRAHVREWLHARMRPVLAEHGVDPARVLLHPFLPHAQFLALAAGCDLGLDSVGWSGGMSALDLFGTGLPVVSVQGAVMRQRQTAALAQALELDAELVASDAAGYVRRAVALGQSPEQRMQLRRQLRARSPALHGQAPAVAAFLAEFLGSVVAPG